MAECDSCHAPIVWAISPAGASSPIDFEPVENGNVLLLRPDALGGEVLAVTLSKDALATARSRVELRVNHYATCPEREEWRRRADAKRADP